MTELSIEEVEQLEDYSRIHFDNRENPFTVAKFQKVFDKKSNTSLLLTYTESPPQHDNDEYLLSAKGYFEVDGKPYWVSSYIDSLRDLKRFESQFATFIVDTINSYEEKV